MPCTTATTYKPLFSRGLKLPCGGNVVDMAVGIVIGAACGSSVRSFVDDALMPPNGLLLEMWIFLYMAS